MVVARGRGGKGVKESKKGQIYGDREYMTLDGEHTIQHKDNVLQNSILET